jgi:hypothetical protein
MHGFYNLAHKGFLIWVLRAKKGFAGNLVLVPEYEPVVV